MLPQVSESSLVQFALEAKPLMPVRQNQDSAEMVQRTDNQDDCDNNIQLY